MVGYLQITAWVFYLLRGHAIRDLAYYLVFYFASPIFHFPFPCERVSFLQYCVSRHQLNHACSSIIVAFLLVRFTDWCWTSV